MDNEYILLHTAYLPPISFFKSIIKKENTLVIEANENYQKRSYRNRAYLSGANKIIGITVPLVQGKNSQQSIKDIKISYDENWVTHHILNIKTSYRQSAFYEHYIEDIIKTLNTKPKFLFDLNQQLLEYILSVLSINDELVYTDQYQNINDFDLSNDVISIPIRSKIDINKLNQKYYPQVFEDRYGFIPELSILDLIFCMGPEAETIIRL